MREQNRDELARLIREQLDTDGVGPETFAKKLPEKSRRAFYNWIAGVSAPRAHLRLELEDALGWESGAVSRVLDAPITERLSLGEVRDWSRVEDPNRPAVRAAELSTAELLLELSARYHADQARMRELEARIASFEVPGADRPGGNVRHLYGLAAHNTEAGRNMEHLENDVDPDEPR